MEIEQQKLIFKIVIDHLDDLNDLLPVGNSKVDGDTFARYLNTYLCNLDTNNLEEYLSSLILYVFFHRNEKIVIHDAPETVYDICSYVNVLSNFVVNNLSPELQDTYKQNGIKNVIDKIKNKGLNEQQLKIIVRESNNN